MSCNSCSNITLPGVAGPAGAPGAAGAAGNGIVSVSFQSTTNPGGTPAVAGYTDTYRITYTDATTFDYDIVNGTVGTNGTNGTSIIEIDTALGGGTTSQTSPSSAQKSFNIPANTWQTDGDMVELEIMAVGELFQGDGFHKIYITIGSAPVPIDLDALFTATLASGYVGCEAKIEPFMHLKLQLSMSSVGTITPVTDFQANVGIYSVESTNPLSTAGYVSKHRGANLTGVPVGGIVPIDVYMVSVDGTVSVKLFYFKLTSYKA
jgi:hypothetical protein